MTVTSLEKEAGIRDIAHEIYRQVMKDSEKEDKQKWRIQ